MGRQRRKVSDREPPAGFLRRLAKDAGGNTLALAAAAVIPLVGMVGSGVDMGRAYLIKTRLQQACDAGVLAARKAMLTNALDANAIAQADAFFDINLLEGSYGAVGVNFVVTDVMRPNAAGTPVASGVVHGEADAVVPMTLMRIFGKEDIALEASCEAELNVANNDVLFVLDVTGSMACTPARTSASCTSYAGTAGNITSVSGRWTTTEETGSRIAGLRTAVTNFFNTLNGATAPGARLRIGFLPYASGVNVGGVLATNSVGSVRFNTLGYQSRVANMNQAWRWTPSTTAFASPTTETFSHPNGSSISSDNCGRYGNNEAFTQGTIVFAPNPSGNPAPAVPAADAHLFQQTAPASITHRQYVRLTAAWTGAPANRACQRTRTTATTTYSTTGWSLNTTQPWTYRSVDYDMTNFVAGIALATTIPATGAGRPWVDTSGARTLQQLAGVAGVTATTHTFDGCVGERATGMDDIDLLPTDDATRWRPMWEEATWIRTRDSASQGPTATNNAEASGRDYDVIYTCPKAAQHLEVMDAAGVAAYLTAANGFVAHGATYHDIGMIWGARMMSLNGAFAAAHTAAANGRPVARHIIFMTDGDMAPQFTAYGPYGIENLDRRITTAGTTNTATLTTAHNTRFQAACTAAKNRGITVWVVSFAQALTTDLTNCASSPTQAFQADDSDDLNDAFARIAARIADLRLTA